MLYELFMVWVVGSITVIAASMVLGGLLCVCSPIKVVNAPDRPPTPRINQSPVK